MAEKEYSASNIQVLKGLEAVRKRPAMYIGGTDSDGLHHLIWELVDNGIDEALAGFATDVSVIIEEDGSVTIRDNGRGIPVDIHPTEKVSALELAATVLHAGGKFDSDTYKVSSGLHGVGLSVVNALSKKCRIEVYKNGKKHVQEYEIGVPKGPVKEVGTTNEKGTMINFLPDDTIFDSVEFKDKVILDRLRQHAYLNGGVRFNFSNKVGGGNKFYGFFFDGGLKSYVRHINMHLTPIQTKVFYAKDVVDDVDIEVAIQYTDDLQSREYAFANNVHNPEGGTHLSGLRTALTRTVNNYINEFGNEKEKNMKLTGDDVREGLTAAISVKISDPQFEGQTKIKLNNTEVTGAVRQLIEAQLKAFLIENPKEAKAITGRVILANKARTAAKAARDAVIRKGALEGSGLPGKLADCSSKKAEECELYIVEGDSAGGPAKQGRNRHNQAILPVFGKPINSEKYRLDKVLASEKIADLIKAIGTGIGDMFDVSKLRYHKIVLMADADVDGAHITTLNLTLFYRHLKKIVENGHLYIAQPPLYKVTFSANDTVWVKDDASLQKLLKERKSAKAPSIQRFKGLGEMNAEQLWETTMNPDTRVLKQVVIEDAEAADRLFDILMGNEVPPRKKYIQTYSSEAELDV
ncbi:DNA gyrase subunit B [Candidatus Dojkabacteria bacterium]|uniref:DNA topoisomerase (ATP-hydrolyzing) n=1 Tax=Candidatus Dojkabacteria bacterium TaxID=2099670 RepID=A0A955RL45_9BACT|nr:DNA gyrase subunit B [Candidatus Dojkabacteria bacterium]